MSSLAGLYLAIAAGAFLTGLSKGGLGGALGTLVTPLLVLVMPAPLAVGLTLPLLITGDACALYAHWGGWDRRIIISILPSTIVGVVLGSIVIGSLSPVTLQHGLGAIAILYTFYKIWERWRKRQIARTLPEDHAGMLLNTAQTSLFGLSTGFASTLANAGGPIFTIYLLMLRLTPSVFVGTSALYYALTNLMKLPAYLSAHILSVDGLLIIAWSLPIIPFGVWTGIILDRHIDMPTFEVIILVFLAVTGVILLLK